MGSVNMITTVLTVHEACALTPYLVVPTTTVHPLPEDISTIMITMGPL